MKKFILSILLALSAISANAQEYQQMPDGTPYISPFLQQEYKLVEKSLYFSTSHLLALTTSDKPGVLWYIVFHPDCQNHTLKVVKQGLKYGDQPIVWTVPKHPYRTFVFSIEVYAYECLSKM